MKTKLPLLAAALVAAASLPLLACGAVAPEEPRSAPGDAAAEAAPAEEDAGLCSSRPESEWCELVLRGGYRVDPRADVCCRRWLDEGLVTP